VEKAKQQPRRGVVWRWARRVLIGIGVLFAFATMSFLVFVTWAGEPISYTELPAPPDSQRLYAERDGWRSGYMYKRSVYRIEAPLLETREWYVKYLSMSPFCETEPIFDGTFDPELHCPDVTETETTFRSGWSGSGQYSNLRETHHFITMMFDFYTGGNYETYEIVNSSCYGVTLYAPDAYRAESKWHEKTGDVVCADEEACTVAIETRCWTYPF